MFFKRVFLSLLLLLTFLLSLLLHAPARVVSGQVPPVLQAGEWGGTLLTGQVSGRYGQWPLYLAWDWRLSALWRLAIGVDAEVRGLVDARVEASRGPLSWRVDMATLRIPAGPSDWLGRGTVLPAWQGGGLAFSRRHGGAWQAGSGSLSTPGGLLKLNLQGQTHEIQLPPARIIWRVSEGALIGDLRQVEGNAALATLTLTADNRIQWQIRDRLLRMKAGYSSQNDPDLVVLTVAGPL